ncbi:MAG: ribonuclease P protein component [Chthoniobacterales bacterium]|nr:ribonuclease P protein component [Chthoniobacterales bacterium]
MAALTLPKSARLSRRADFTAVRERGDSWHGRCMVMGGWLSGNGTPASCGVITSRKVGSAVERSRARRRLREIFRLHRGLLPAGLWMVVVARRAAATAPFGALSEEWRALAGRAGYLKS